ncbi:hypothetical protein [Flavobacterium quisquiliarum]|uniref:Uncharacterized protein n=1 Tax=Flavobacterium quisquiliarum TaxID=1834436 RepID=A0ABV8W3V2_9FLAO|nr:hypothetical protein [Flavobacterium quisquiliarum]MBW1654532.1 hypothetical protein [Flavobacterium quisquiliarum]NWL01783.1 hypothetical protein [Flavobacterium collinsii]
MKKIFCFCFSLFFLITAHFSYSQQSKVKKNIEQLVRNAKIKNGHVDLKAQKAIYIEIPTRGGYLEFKADSYKEIVALLKEVLIQYKREFAFKSNLTHSPNCKWNAIPNAHPSTAQYRYCQYSDVLCYWQTSNCAICCDNEEPPVKKK